MLLFKSTSFALSLCLLFVAQLSFARSNDCSTLATTALEQLYCKIKAEGEGRDLPSLEDFRQNAPRIQELLLKRKAEKLGLKLPKVKASNIKTPPQPAKIETNAIWNKPIPVLNEPISALAECHLSADVIRCSNGSVFNLALNLPNSKLELGALGSANSLKLPTRAQQTQLSDDLYLSQSYEVYLRKMLKIGMGASTMSFSRFYSIYEDSLERNFSFTQRFANMYEFLKVDKQRNQIPPQLSEDSPKIDQCEVLSTDLIVCDSGEVNWLFLK